MKNLKFIRKKQQFTQERLAQQLGVSRSTISMWETGVCQPDNQMLVELSHVLGVSVDYLLGNAEIPDVSAFGGMHVQKTVLGSNGHSGAIMEDPELAKLMELAGKLPKSALRLLIEVAESMIK